MDKQNESLSAKSSVNDKGRTLPGSHTVIRKLRITPKFHETDMMGVIHNSIYFRWFEDGRLQIMLEVIPLEEALNAGYMFSVVENSCKYRSFSRFGDSLVVTTRHRINPIFSGKFTFNHSVVNEKTKAEVASGTTTLSLIDTNFCPVKELPANIWDRYCKLV